MGRRKSMAEKQKYWYKRYIGACPVCGKDKSYKVRQYLSDKPDHPDDRVFYLSDQECYDHCLELEAIR